MKTNPFDPARAAPQRPVRCHSNLIPQRLGRFSLVSRILPLLLLLTLPIVVQAQFLYATNNGAITITRYTGPGGDVTIPAMINVGGNNLPVTSIGDLAFNFIKSLLSVTIPDSVTSIGYRAFFDCDYLTTVTVGNSVTNIGAEAFQGFFLTGVYFRGNAPSLGSSVFSTDHYATVYYSPGTTGWGATFGGLPTVLLPFTYTNNNGTITITGYTGSGDAATIPETILGLPVTSIGEGAFFGCGLASVTIPNSVTSIGSGAFTGATNLTGVYFRGNAPSLSGSSVFSGDNNATVYYLPGSTGWGSTFGGVPAVLWNPQVPTSDASFGVRTNRFGFTITGTANIPILIEVCTNFAGPVWVSLQSSTITNGSIYFSDPLWTNFPSRFYRIGFP